MTVQLQGLELSTANPALLAGFYGGMLGLPVSYASEGDSITVTAGASQLVFRREAGFTGRYHFAFNVPENRLTAAQAFLQARSIPPVVGESGESIVSFASWNAHVIYFFDPAGNIAEFIARHELPNATLATDAPFTAAEILCISEIGLPADSVPSLTEMLTKRLGIDTYRGSGPTFAAIGDENGLFILVKTGRLWFSTTDMPAEELPIRATIQCPHGEFVVEGVPYHVHTIDVPGEAKAPYG